MVYLVPHSLHIQRCVPERLYPIFTWFSTFPHFGHCFPASILLLLIFLFYLNLCLLSTPPFMDPAPWVRSGGPVGHPPKAGAFGRSPGSRENPWAFFGYFLSQQKVTPRRGGETRQKTFRTRQDCEGPDQRVAVKRKRDFETHIQNRKTDTFKNRPPGPILKKKQAPPPARQHIQKYPPLTYHASKC